MTRVFLLAINQIIVIEPFLCEVHVSRNFKIIFKHCITLPLTLKLFSWLKIAQWVKGYRG